jgi:hypothetical protein
VKHVVDSGMSRCGDSYHDIVGFSDTESPGKVQLQRAGRAGRVQAGGYTRIRVEGAAAPTAPRLSVDAVVKVLAMETHHLQLRASDLSLCCIGDDLIELARAELASYRLRESDLLRALSQISLSLRDAAVLLRAMCYGVGYEAAAILSVKSVGRWQPAAVFDLDELVRLCTETMQSRRCARPIRCGDGTSSHQGEAEVVAVVDKLRFQDKVQDVFFDLVGSLSLKPSVQSRSEHDERLAIAFLVCPERLVWTIDDVASFLGARLIHSTPEYYVVGLLSNCRHRGLRCNFKLPLSDWVIRESGAVKPVQTVNFNGDSTFGEFRSICCSRLRTYGYGQDVTSVL